MDLTPLPRSRDQRALRSDLIKRLTICLHDADTLDTGACAAIEISLAIHHLGGKVPISEVDTAPSTIGSSAPAQPSQ